MLRHEAKSLHLNRAIQKKLLESGEVDRYISEALAWAERFSAERQEDIWLSEWITVLRAAQHSRNGLSAMYAMMSGESEHHIDMRQSSPWAGVLSVRERARVLSEFAEQWGSQKPEVCHDRTTA